MSNYSLDTEFISLVNSVTGELFMSRRGQHLFRDIDQSVWVAKKVKLVEVLK